MEEVIEQYPTWKQTAIDFAKTTPQSGSIVKKNWLADRFGIELPSYGSSEQITRAQLKFLTAFENFHRFLIQEYHIHLKSKGSGMYEVLAPNNQTKVAVGNCHKEISKALQKTNFRLRNVDIAALNAEERKENSDARAKLAMQASMIRGTKRVRLPVGM